jgi:G3E family GTPase
VILLAGFLGTGKTTLLRRLLDDAVFEHTAVLINEVGEVGLDHQIVFGAGGTPTGDAAAGVRTAILLANGCVCCTVRDDLAVALDDLMVRALRGQIPRFERVIIETTGLADPVPVIEAIGSSVLTSLHYRLARVVTTVDAASDPARIDRYPASIAQVVCADDLVVTRSDLASDAAIEHLQARLGGLNPDADILRLDRDFAAVASRFLAEARPVATLQRAMGRTRVEDDGGAGGAAGRGDDVEGAPPFSRSGPLRPLTATAAHRFRSTHAGIKVSTMRFAGPSVWSEALKAIEASLAASAGEVLRVKGVLRLVGHPHPMIVQWAGGHVSPISPLPGALADGDAGYLVVIAAADRTPSHDGLPG